MPATTRNPTAGTPRLRAVPRPAPLAAARGGRPARTLAAAALVLGLLAAFLLVRAAGSDGPPPGPVAPGAVPAAAAENDAAVRPGRPAPRRARLLAALPPAVRRTCRPAADPAGDAVAALACRGNAGTRVEFRAFASAGALRARYRARAGGRGGGGGGPACAAGRPEERAWSAAADPGRALGRYACTTGRAGAVVIWTRDRLRLLGTARRADGDLAALFRWWARAVP